MGASIALLGFISLSNEETNTVGNIFRNILNFFEQFFQSSNGSTGTKTAASSSIATAPATAIQVQISAAQATQPPVTRVSFEYQTIFSRIFSNFE